MATAIGPQPSFKKIGRIVAAVFRVAMRGGRARIVLSHPKTGKPTLCELDQAGAPELIADVAKASGTNND